MKHNGKVKIIGITLIIVSLMMTLVACDDKQESTPETKTEFQETVDLTINVECEENLLFSTYDVSVYIDGDEIGKVDHGGSNTFKEKVTEGKHVIEFKSEEDSSVDGEKNVYIEEETELNFKLHCHSDRVDVELLDESSNETTVLTTEAPTEAEETVLQKGDTRIALNIKCDENAFFSTYNVKIYIDEDLIGTLPHGDTKTFEAFVNKGLHTIRFVEDENNSDPAEGSTAITVNESKSYNYGIHCYSTEVSVEDFNNNSEYENDDSNKQNAAVKKAKKSKKKKKHKKKKKKKGPKISLTYAWGAFRMALDEACPYGYRLHQITGVIAERKAGKNWFLKCKVTIKNAFRAKYHTVAEARIGGTNNNPKIKHFYIYD